MSYITHDTPKNTAAINLSSWVARTIGWLKALWNSPASRDLYPHSEHLLHDVGLTRMPPLSAIDYALTDRRNYSPVGNNVTFADLHINDHLDRKPRKL